MLFSFILSLSCIVVVVFTLGAVALADTDGIYGPDIRIRVSLDGGDNSPALFLGFTDDTPPSVGTLEPQMRIPSDDEIDVVHKLMTVSRYEMDLLRYSVEIAHPVRRDLSMPYPAYVDSGAQLCVLPYAIAEDIHLPLGGECVAHAVGGTR
jgi:hypothetical protein